VLVTGADGFIGSHLVEHLLRAGAQVTALAQYNSFNFWGWLEDIPALNEIHIVTGDIRDSHFCLSLLKNIDVVFHLAAQTFLHTSGTASPQLMGTTSVFSKGTC
jgi:nucleoside-diphosphate-sugar epimerase